MDSLEAELLTKSRDGDEAAFNENERRYRASVRPFQLEVPV